LIQNGQITTKFAGSALQFEHITRERVQKFDLLKSKTFQ